MKMDLAGVKTFHYRQSSTEGAFVKNEILYLTKGVSVKNVMVAMTYDKYGNTCHYCGRKFSKKIHRTIDHKYPLMFGGVTILSNLVPCCTECNELKSNLTEEEFFRWKILDDTSLKEKYRYMCIGKHEQERICRGTILPKDWFEKRQVNILADVNLDVNFGKKKDEAKRFYWKYGVMKDSVVISRNCILLDGFTSLMVAKEEEIPRVPIIKLENVVVDTTK